MDSSNFPPLADRPEEQEEGVEVSSTVLNVMSVAAEQDLTLGQYLELALCCLSTVVGELSDELERVDDMDPKELMAALMATIAKLEISYDIIADIDLDPKEEGEDNED